MTALKQKFILILFLRISKLFASEICTLLNGDSGLCVTLSNCERDKDAVVFSSNFCSDDFSEICCEREKIKSEKEKVPRVESEVDFENYESFKLFDFQKCAKLSSVFRISGGEEADLLEFPWNALIGYANLDTVEFNCGGSLITVHNVLSAAHCFKTSKRTLHQLVKIVRLGEHRKSTPKDCQIQNDGIEICADPVQDIEINSSDIIIHPEYTDSSTVNDIAIIRLNEAAKINQNNIKPICLPFRKSFEILPKSMTVIGFGRTESSVSNSDVLRKVNVRIKSNEQCITEYESHLSLEESQFCAGDEKDSCKGDSGSSTHSLHLFEDSSIRYVQYGIVSYGDALCGSFRAGIYTKVYNYLQWILENVK
ncbi:hypothetical protein PVAND_001861 [Polypedilum vanderplanki]|uniref:Peptidase S1 domain-containing protein n=1 Tax=Polypedilum vanderplanki TaxID=319348 RepID=A0A9J6BP74_POLVA|nr:hypothetical protein PVAND_001861 [Polypedilum vanderplanki]